jgi:hypothetical protein
LQLTAARTGAPTDAPLLTIDTAMALVDQALARLGSTQGCTHGETDLAFEYLANPANATAYNQGFGIVISAPAPLSQALSTP